MSFAKTKNGKMKNRKKSSSLRTPHHFGSRRSMWRLAVGCPDSSTAFSVILTRIERHVSVMVSLTACQNGVSCFLVSHKNENQSNEISIWNRRAHYHAYTNPQLAKIVSNACKSVSSAPEGCQTWIQRFKK